MTKSYSPKVYIIAGPNGAGKTTFANEFLPDFVNCREFLNADLIAAGLSPFAPEKQNFRAGRLLIARIRELMNERQDFGFETTLSGKGYIPKFKEMKEIGYQIMMFFLWLPNANLANIRVKTRVKQGGHHVPAAIIRRRYKAGLQNFFHFYRQLTDAWWFYDASQLPPVVIAQQGDGKIELLNEQLFNKIQRV
jgi:predicted ABC-type ATPase